MKIADPAFAKAVADLGSGIEATTPRSVDLVFEDDLPVRLTLHPDGGTVLVDAFAFDAADLAGEADAAMCRTLLQLNGLAMSGEPFAISLTPESVVAVTVRIALERAGNGRLAEPVAYATMQARQVRDLLQAIASADGGGLTTYNV
jgi:hypothetical protein